MLRYRVVTPTILLIEVVEEKHVATHTTDMRVFCHELVVFKAVVQCITEESESQKTYGVAQNLYAGGQLIIRSTYSPNQRRDLRTHPALNIKSAHRKLRGRQPFHERHIEFVKFLPIFVFH